MTQRRLTLQRFEPPPPDVRRRERAARAGRRGPERTSARRAERARREMEFLAAGPAGYPFSRRS
jgi:hypothetical protein